MFKSFVPVVGLALSPFYIASLFIAVVYRLLIHLWLKCTQSDYVGLMDILEAWFDGENNRYALSIVNIIINVKLTAVKNGEELRNSLKERVMRVSSKKKYGRTNCIIEKKFGLRFWRLGKSNLEEQVIQFNASSTKEVEDYLSSVANAPIQNKRLFEIHVCEQAVDGKYPMIFRAHHAMADGYAIRQLVLDDQVSHSPCYNSVTKPSSASPNKHFWRVFRDNVALAVDVVKMFVYTPTLCIEQYLQPGDKNSLKADTLSGDKILRWRTGDLKMIKEIHKITNKTITEIFLSAMSKSLDNLFKTRGETVPHVTIVFPMRKSQESSGLANEFIPVGFQLPVSSLNREMDIVERIQELENAPSYKINYFVPRFAFMLYPMDLPDWVYKCTETTGLFSNVPGPKQKVAFKEFEVDEFAFFLPNLLMNNGLGVMLTSYADKFVCSVIIDRKITQRSDDAQQIVDGIMEYINDTHNRL